MALRSNHRRAGIEDIEDVIALPGTIELQRTPPLIASRWCFSKSGQPLCACAPLDSPFPNICPLSDIGAENRTLNRTCEEPRSRPRPPIHRNRRRSTGILSGKAAGSRVIALRTTTSDSALRAAARWIVTDCDEISLNPSTQTWYWIALSKRNHASPTTFPSEFAPQPTLKPLVIFTQFHTTQLPPSVTAQFKMYMPQRITLATLEAIRPPQAQAN
jgi:hypothetical protein